MLVKALVTLSEHVMSRNIHLAYFFLFGVERGEEKMAG